MSSWQGPRCGLAVRGLLEEQDALEMAYQCAYDLAKRAYNLDTMTR